MNENLKGIFPACTASALYETAETFNTDHDEESLKHVLELASRAAVTGIYVINVDTLSDSVCEELRRRGFSVDWTSSVRNESSGMRISWVKPG